MGWNNAGELRIIFHISILWVLVKIASLLMILTSTHNICHLEKIKKHYPLIVQVTPSFL